MRSLNKIKVFVIVLCMVTTAASAYAFVGALEWTGTFKAAETKWDYRIVPLSVTAAIADGDFERELNRLGAEGWELVSVITLQAGGYYIMKRPRT